MLNLSAGSVYYRPWIIMSYVVRDVIEGFHRTYIDEWDANPLDWTEAFKEYHD